MKMSFLTGFPVLAFLCSCLFLTAMPATAMAQEVAGGNFQGLIPPSGSTPSISYGTPKPDGEDTHPALRLTPDKSELVRLDRDAASVIVGNPNHLGVLMDNPRLLILIPRQPGATYMTLLDKQGAVIMQRHVIVASPKSDYIRIRRSCANGARDCAETSVYYCPGMCHKVDLNQNTGSGNVPPPMPSYAAQVSGDAAAPGANGGGDTGGNGDETATEPVDNGGATEGDNGAEEQ